MKLFDRDLSWLSYNSRILQEAACKSNLLGERLKFISIADSNLKKFISERYFPFLNFSNDNSEKKLNKLNKKISKQFAESGQILSDIFISLKNLGIEICAVEQLDEIQLKYLNEWFRLKIKPILHPQFLTSDNIVLSFKNEQIYLFVELTFHEEKGNAIIEIPLSKSDRFIEIPTTNSKSVYVLAESVIRFYLPELFIGHEIPSTCLFETISGNEFYSINESLASSKQIEENNQPIRSYFLFDKKNIPKEIIKSLFKKTQGNSKAVSNKNSFLALGDFIELGKRLSIEMKDTPLTPELHTLDKVNSILNSINKNDHLLYFPYHSSNILINLLKEATTSSSVTKIFITLYSADSHSLLVENLIIAAANGIQVFAYLEIKSSESEEDNVKLANKLEIGGVKVCRNFPGLKINAKTILIEEETTKIIKRTVLLNTGNFNKTTANRSTDIAILTSNKTIAQDIANFFDALQLHSIDNFKPTAIAFSPYNFRLVFSKEIQKCIAKAQQNIATKIILKINNLEDEKIIQELYEAAQAGVKIEIIVRTICCMKPKENIRIISIVDRFLEHAHIFYFSCGEEEAMYTTSGDLMSSNLNRQMEFLLPIINPVHRKQLSEILQLQLKDNVKARIIDNKQKNKFEKAKINESEIRSQLEIQKYFSQKKI